VGGGPVTLGAAVVLLAWATGMAWVVQLEGDITAEHSRAGAAVLQSLPAPGGYAASAVPPTGADPGSPQPLRSPAVGVIGSLIFDNGAPDLVSGNEMTHWDQAEDFTLTEAATLQSVRFWTIEYPGAWDGTCQYAIYADAGGAPGAEIDSGSVSLSHVATGRSLSETYDEFDCEFDLPAALPLSAGTYWVALHMSSDCTTRDDVYWETGTPGSGSYHLEDFECADSWTVGTQHLAFQLYGCDPPPVPTNPDPADGATDVPVDTVLAWGGACQLLDGFEDGDIAEYVILSGTAPSVTAAAAHDGSFGLESSNPATTPAWIYRDDAAVQLGYGDTLSFWVQILDDPDSRAYCGFGASSAGTYSLVAAPNTGELIIQKNEGYGHTSLVAVSQTWVLNQWYLLEVQWDTGGNITGRLYDSDGQSLLNTVSVVDTTYTQGGIALRGFDHTYQDTITRCGPAGPPTAVLLAAGGPQVRTVPRRDPATAIGWDAENMALIYPAAPAAATITAGAEANVAEGSAGAADGKVLDSLGNVVGAELILAPPQAQTSAALSVLVFRPFLDTASRITGLGYTVATTTNVGDLTRANLQNYDVLWIDVDVDPNAYQSQNSEIDDWVSVDGGGLVVVQPNVVGAVVSVFPTGYEVTIYNNAWPGDYGATIVDPTHPIVVGLGDIDLPGNFDWVRSSDIGTAWDIVAVDAETPSDVALLAGQHGAGRLVFSTALYASAAYDPGSDQFLIQMIDWLGACVTTYDVYFGTDDPPTTLICDDVTDLTCDPTPAPGQLLDPNTTYYWQVVASNCCGTTEGPVWSFTTAPPAQLIATEPPFDGSLPKTQNNLILCVFDVPIMLPATGCPLRIRDMTNGCADVSNQFVYVVDPDDPNGCTLEARETDPNDPNGLDHDVLPDRTWYQVESAPGWTTVVPFQFEVYTLVGDCNNSGRVTTYDYSCVKAVLPQRGDLRPDLNGSGRVTTYDYSVVKANLIHRAPAKPALCP